MTVPMLPQVTGTAADAQALEFIPALHAKVGLTTPLPRIVVVHELRSDITGERYTAHYSADNNEIVISSGALAGTPKKIQSLWLHEVMHKVVADHGLSATPDAQTHHEIFGVLLAVAYRRAGLLSSLDIYDFGDRFLYENSAANAYHSSTDPMNQPCDGQELVDRFEYIIKRSAEMAATGRTIEELARWIVKNDFMDFCNPPRPVRPLLSPWLLTLGMSLLGCLAGATATAAVLLR